MGDNTAADLGNDPGASFLTLAPDADQTPLLHLAVDTQNLELVQLLLEQGADWRTTPLHLAAFNGHTSTAELLLQRGAKVNAEDDRGRTPLALAEGRGHARCAELLEHYGAVRLAD